jgi:putative nucleotidyltransferase with HDIG domain
MKRVLFVDDEPRILEALQRMLRMQGHAWDMAFVGSGEAALQAFAARPFDVIVSDMRMPVMDGATLLTRVRDEYPDTVRIVLSGHTDREAAARVACAAHQFLMKPSTADSLTSAVNRACELRERLQVKRIREALGSVDTLPTVPRIYAELTERLAMPEVPLDQIVDVLSQDVAMSAKVLQLVNSSFFGFSREVTTLRTALSLLGMTMLKRLVLSVEVFRAYGGKRFGDGCSLDALQQHSLEVAGLAMLLVSNRAHSEDAYLAGMLHDIGKLILAERLPDEFDGILRTADETQRSLYQVEQEVLGVTHAELGAYLLSLWHLPDPIVEAIAYHHQAPDTSAEEVDLRLAVQLANALVTEEHPHTGWPGYPTPPADPVLIMRLGLQDRVAEWRARTTTQNLDA